MSVTGNASKNGRLRTTTGRRGRREVAKEVLQRKTFSASRLDEYASVDGLTKLTGQPVENWPLVIIKELIDNALDNAENAGLAPAIKVTVGSDGFVVEEIGRAHV